ncbi:MAG: DUF1090 domain-containing protein [Betaproteobacteria bacterium]|nr:DUF1090 domain-containing protein [Betaproteobacteria bacterium]
MKSRLAVVLLAAVAGFAVALPAAAQMTVGCRQKIEEVQWKIDYAEETDAVAYRRFLELQEEKLKQKCADGSFAREQKIRVEAARLNLAAQQERLSEEEAKLLDAQMQGDEERIKRQKQKIEERRQMLQEAEQALGSEQEREKPL